MQIQVAERRLDPGSNPAWGMVAGVMIIFRTMSFQTCIRAA